MNKFNSYKILVISFLICFLMASVTYGETRLKIGSNRLGTSFYVQGATIADTITKYIEDVSVEAMPIAGAVANIKLVDTQRNLDFALTMNVNAKAAMDGIGGIEKPQNIRSLLGKLDVYYIGILARKDLPFETLEGLCKNKAPIRLFTQAKGSTAEMLTAQLLESCDTTYEDIEEWGGTVTFTDPENITNSFKDGYCDVFVLNVNRGHPIITEIALQGNLKFLPLTNAQQKFMHTKYGFVPGSLPANSFADQTEDIPTGLSSTMIIVHKDMNDNLAYQITKAVMEHKDDLVRGHKAFNDFTPEMANNPDFLGDVPLHPGAIKYFEETKQINN